MYVVVVGRGVGQGVRTSLENHNIGPPPPLCKQLEPFFLSLYTARPSFEYYRQVYFVLSGLEKVGTLVAH